MQSSEKSEDHICGKGVDQDLSGPTNLSVPRRGSLLDIVARIVEVVVRFRRQVLSSRVAGSLKIIHVSGTRCVECYSYLSATIGSTFIARRAGM